MEDCEFCNGEFEHTTIRKYDNWELQLFLSQYYLGRCLVKLDRHIEDVNELEKHERNELFEKILPEVRKALNNSFSPDHYNYATLGNDCRHLHFHVVPRYENKRKFKGREYKDENWNRHYKHDQETETPDRNFDEIRSEIESKLGAMRESERI
jgi:diadenosine tetraphosphate (Ap4A) HIT family hydrolase